MYRITMPRTRSRLDVPTDRRAARPGVSLASPGPRRHGAPASASAAVERVAERRDGDDLEAVDGRRRAAPAAAAGRSPGRSRAGRPRAAGARARPRPQLAEQADLADRDGPGATGRSRRDEARASASGRSRPGSSTRQAAGEVGVDVVAAEPDPGPPAEDRDEQREPVGVDPARRRARACRSRPGATSAWTSTRSGRLPSSVGATTLPGAAPSCSPRNARAGSATSRRPALAHLEDADLLGRAEAVLRGAQEAQRPRSARPRGRGRRRRGARASSVRRACRPS